MSELRKKRILLNNEASFLATGYAVIGFEVLSRLAATGKYDIAELASYGLPNDQRQGMLKWGYYPNMPDPNDGEGNGIYHSDVLFQFGKWRFEQTCLDFLPDMVFAVTDPWMCEHLVSSPFRNYYNLSLLIPCDSEPMEHAWVDSYMSCDRIFSYTDWGGAQYKKQSNNHKNFGGTVSPGVDPITFAPVPNKEKHKADHGLPPDSLIIGTVMRNQKRKLYPDLIESFDKLLQVAPDSIKDRLFLYLHAAIPDIGWDIPTLIKNSNCGHRILITYACLACNSIFSQVYGGARVCCPRCGKNAAITPSTQVGIPREALANIINYFDVYVQYANKEGLGIPAVEAASCGVHVMAVDYSGMVDVIKKTGGTPISVKRFIYESETHSKQAYPDNDDLVTKLLSFLTAQEHIRMKKSLEARQGTEKYFNWDKCAKSWENYFDSVQIPPIEQTWASQPKIFSPQINGIPDIPNYDFVRWLFVEILREPRLVNTYLASRMVRDLEYGVTQDNFGDLFQSDTSLLGAQTRFKNYTRNDALNKVLEMRQKFNHFENMRWASIQKRMVRQ